MNIIFLKPYLDSKIWGGEKLEIFNYKTEGKKIGEALIVSCLIDKPSIILNEDIKEKNLYDFFTNNREFFGNYEGEYPLLTKIIDANSDLSIQVHPNDQYAKMKFNKSGKNEAWYILEAKQGASIIYGTTALNRQDIEKSLENNALEKILKSKEVKTGDVIYVPAGTIHAIKSGLLIYEIQQSCDITFRLFDYNRLENGIPRELHIEDSLNVIKYSDPVVMKKDGYLIYSDFFKLYEINNKGINKIIPPNDALWLEMTIIHGQGTIDNFKIKKGSSMIIRTKYAPTIIGDMKILVGYK